MPTPPPIPAHLNACSRCGRRLRLASSSTWNVEAKGGVIVALLCPTCQTVEENTEAEINLATLTYHQDEDGFIRTNPKP